MIEERREHAALATLTPEWEELLTRAPRAGIYQTPEWLLPWWAIFASPSDRLRLLLVREDGRLRALLPLREDGAGAMEFLGAGITGVHDLVAESGWEQPAASALLRDLGGCGQPCVLDRLPEDSPLARDPGVERREMRPVLALPGTVAAFRDSLPPGLKAKADGRDLERLARRGRPEILRVHGAGPEAVASWMDLLFGLRAAGAPSPWGGGPDDRPVREFHRAVARGMQRKGRLRLWGLTVDACPAAAIYGFRYGSAVSYALGGSDPGLAGVGPAAILLAAAIEDAIVEGARTFEFPPGGRREAARWGATDRVHVKRVLVPRSLEDRARQVT